MIFMYYLKVYIIACTLLFGANGGGSPFSDELRDKIWEQYLSGSGYNSEEQDMLIYDDHFIDELNTDESGGYNATQIDVSQSPANYYYDNDGTLCGVDFDIKNLINQRTLNKYCCSGASALMAAQSLGYYTNTSLDEFWTDIKESTVPGEGFFAGGMINPYLTEWLTEEKCLPATRVPYVTSEMIRTYITDGKTVIACVTKGQGTHWVYIYGWYEKNGDIVFKIADPWGINEDSKEGITYEKTRKELEYQLETASKWNSTGTEYNYPTDAVVICKRI